MKWALIKLQPDFLERSIEERTVKNINDIKEFFETTPIQNFTWDDIRYWSENNGIDSSKQGVFDTLKVLHTKDYRATLNRLSSKPTVVNYIGTFTTDDYAQNKD